jgi:HSP20 family molecular chaperone IbpA
MSKHNYSNSVNLSSLFNDVVSSIYTITSTKDASRTNSYGYDYVYYPLKDNFWSVVEEFSYPIVSTPPYPVANYSIDENLNSIISIAVTGFSDEEISIRREDLKLIVEGKKSKDKGVEDKKKYFYRNIAERDFKIEYQGSDSWDFDKLEAKMSKGILNIVIPVREDCKPIKQSYTIKK